MRQVRIRRTIQEARTVAAGACLRCMSKRGFSQVNCSAQRVYMFVSTATVARSLASLRAPRSARQQNKADVVNVFITFRGPTLTWAEDCQHATGHLHQPRVFAVEREVRRKLATSDRSAYNMNSKTNSDTALFFRSRHDAMCREFPFLEFDEVAAPGK